MIRDFLNLKLELNIVRVAHFVVLIVEEKLALKIHFDIVHGRHGRQVFVRVGLERGVGGHC